MILHRLTLKDFGLFSGEQTFNLTPRMKYKKRRPVILIGGKNGTGKTTIVEAVRLCLCGHRQLKQPRRGETNPIQKSTY